MTLRLAIAGATGRTGNPIAWAANGDATIDLVACVAPSIATNATRSLPGDGVEHAASLADVVATFDVLLDLTRADVAVANLETAVDRGAHAVLGATGVDDAALERLGSAFAEAGRGLMYVPNFSIGAVLMMRLAAQVAGHLPSAAIVETHHAGKLDAPSGTAMRTAELIAAARRQAGFPAWDAADHGGGAALGDDAFGVPVHSLRMAGAVAHQEVVFGGEGELLTIRHDAIDRSCYSPGALLAVRHVPNTVGLTVGLENIL